jgi:hypothetical protein
VSTIFHNHRRVEDRLRQFLVVYCCDSCQCEGDHVKRKYVSTRRFPYGRIKARSSKICSHMDVRKGLRIASSREDPSSAPSVCGMRSRYRINRRPIRSTTTAAPTIHLSFPFNAGLNGTAAYAPLPPPPCWTSFPLQVCLRVPRQCHGKNQSSTPRRPAPQRACRTTSRARGKIGHARPHSCMRVVVGGYGRVRFAA